MDLIEKLRYMGHQYAAGQTARGGERQKHYLEEAADEIEALRAENQLLKDALFRKAKERAGIVDLNFHDTRHEAITRLARKYQVLDLARIVGHANIRELMTYFNPTIGELVKRLRG